jgi:leucyl aminopeptidase
MDVKLTQDAAAQIETECLAMAVVDAADPGAEKPQPVALSGDAAVRAAASELIASREITGRIFETVMIHRPQGLKAKRLLLVGGGKQKNFSSHELRKVAGTAVRFLKPKNIRSFAFVVPPQGATELPALRPPQRPRDGAPSTGELAEGWGTPPHKLEDAVRAIVEGALVADFDPDIYKSDRKDQRMSEMTVLVTRATDSTVQERSRPQDGALNAALAEARILGEAQNFTRELVNEPGNRMTPTVLAQRAREMIEAAAKSADGAKLTVETFGADKIKELKMGAFWSVAQGSEEAPALIVIRYEPPDAPAEPVIGLVGKGITFDSGGISIKPSDGMEKMKYDMAGGAAMLGAMRAIAQLRPKVRVIAIVCATENMPSGKAQKPGDVQIAMSGKSIEIINTDAEGRLVLADGLHYARQLGATHLIDAATLTGACVVALAGVNVGVFANNEEMFARFRRALELSGEKMWRLPLDEEYKELIRSNIADMMNSGGRYGGAVTAAMFLKEFVGETPWIHLDIAGTAWMDENKAWIAKGPTGVAVRSIVEFVRSFVSS